MVRVPASSQLPRLRYGRTLKTMIAERVMTEAPMRICPICGLFKAVLRCPNDGATLLEPTWIQATQRLREEGEILGGRYVVEDDLAVGSSGRVYLARDHVTGRRVALKLLAVDPEVATESAIDRMFEEAKAAASLTSTHTASIYDIGSDEGAPFLVMERVEGRSLNDLLELLRKKHRKLTVDAACELAAGVLRSLAEAHEAGLVHRNLSPAHLMLAHTGCGELTVRLLGFGSVRSDGGRLTRDGMVATPAFMSPEQVQNQPLDGRSDLYSLGVVLYRSVSGKLPFVHKEGYGLMKMHVETEAEALELQGDFGPQFARFIQRMLAKKPANRHRTALDALVTLQAITGRRLHAVPHLATLDSELEDGFGDHLVDSSGKPSDFLDAKTNVYGISPIARVGPGKELDRVD